MSGVSTPMGLTVLRWPAQVRPRVVEPNLSYSNAITVNPYNGVTQTQEYDSAAHTVAVTVESLRGESLSEMRAFLAQLRGVANRFVMGVYPCRYAPNALGAPNRVTQLRLSVDSTTITVDRTDITCDQTLVKYETAFAVNRCPDVVTIEGTLYLNSNQVPLRVGNYISFDDASAWRHLHLVVGMVHDLPTGLCTLTVEPPMRILPTPVTVMQVHNPSAIWMMGDDAQGMLRVADKFASVTFEARAALPFALSLGA